MKIPFSITLNEAQIRHVLREAEGEHGIAKILSGLGDNQQLAALYNSLDKYPELSSSLITGLIVLRCFPSDGSALGIKEVTELVNTNTSNVHRYVKTLVVAGLLERDPDTRRYYVPHRAPR